MSERVIQSDAVVCIDRFSGALVRKYRARMIPGQPVFLDRDKAMEATTAYYDKVEIVDSGLTSYCPEHAKQGESQ